MLGGTNDKELDEFQFSFSNFVNSISNTNVIVSEIHFNKYISIHKLNHQLRLICSRFSNTLFAEMNYCTYLPSRKYFTLHKCQSLLREILHIDYKIKIDTYQNRARHPEHNNMITKTDKSTQTLKNQVSGVLTTTGKNSDFFRV